MIKTVVSLFFVATVLMTATITTSIDLQFAEGIKSKAENTVGRVGIKSYGSANKNIVCGDRLCSEISSEKKVEPKPQVSIESKPISLEIMQYTKIPPPIDPEKGYFVSEISDGLFWLIDGSYQVMFLTTGQGVIVVDAPESIGEKYLKAISDVTDEPVTHVIYSHIHKDHIGAAHQFPAEAVFISHEDVAQHLAVKNDPDRPVPTVSFDDTYTLSVGNQLLELSYVGAFHSKGDIVIYAPKQKVAMVVDLFHPGAAPFKAFGITKNMNQYIAVHDKLVESFDFDVLISGHEQILATKDHIQTNKQFTMDVMTNAIKATQQVDFAQIVQVYGFEGRAAVFDRYFDELAQVCSELTIEQWQGKINDLEPFMEDHCMAMLFYVMID